MALGTRMAGLALACALIACASLPPEETAEIMAQGESKALNDELTPPRGPPRVLLIGLDGVADRQLRSALEQGLMPQLGEVLGAQGDGSFEHAYGFRKTVTLFPSITAPGWSSVFTGSPPARHGVVGNEFFVRKGRQFYAPVPTCVSSRDHTMQMINDQLLGHLTRTRTLYERADVRSYSSVALLHRGADLYTITEPRQLLDLLANLFKGIANPDAIGREIYEELDTDSVDSTLEAIDEHGLADLQVSYFPGVDLYTHHTENPLRSQRKYLSEVIDPALGRLFDAYRSKGALESTHIVITADHGHTPVPSDERHRLDPWSDEGMGAVLKEVGFRVRAQGIESGSDDFQAVMACQGPVLYVYLANREECDAEGEPCEWESPPRLEEDILPVARRLYEASRAEAEGKDDHDLAGAIDLILVRYPEAREGRHSFGVFDGETIVPVPVYIEREGRKDLVRFAERLGWLGTGPEANRVGDLLVMTKGGLARVREDRFYFAKGRYRSVHGTAHPSDSYVPLVVARQGSSPGELRALAEPEVGDAPDVLDVTPIVLRLLRRGP